MDDFFVGRQAHRAAKSLVAQKRRLAAAAPDRLFGAAIDIFRRQARVHRCDDVGQRRCGDPPAGADLLDLLRRFADDHAARPPPCNAAAATIASYTSSIERPPSTVLSSPAAP